MLLYLKKSGAAFHVFHPEAEEVSDLESCRITLEFIDKKGRHVTGDLLRSTDPKRYNIILPDWTHKTRFSCSAYFTPAQYRNITKYPFTKAGALQLVNRFSAIRYTGVELVDDLPEVQYPEEVLQLERDYNECERRAAYEDLLQTLRERPLNWRYLRSWQIENLTPDELKELTLAAAKTWIEGMREKGPQAWDDLTPEIHAKRIANIFTDLRKRGEMNLYSESCIINPLHDLEFMAQLVEIDPAFAYPIEEYTPEQFAHLAAE